MPSQSRRPRRGEKEARKKGRRRRRVMTFFSHPGMVASLWILVAILCGAAVFDGAPAMGLEGAFFQAIPQPGIAQGILLLGGLGALGLLTIALRRWGRSGDVDSASRDYRIDVAALATPGRLAVMAMVAGSLLMVGDWLSAHRYMPAGAMTAPVGEAMESYDVEQGGRHLQAMLPLRTSAHFLELEGDKPEVSLQFARPNAYTSRPDREALPRLGFGQSIDVEDRRITFSGLNYEQPQFTAVLRVDGASEVQWMTIGEEFRVGEAQRRLRVVDATANYLEGLALAPGMDAAQAQLMLLRQQYPMEAMGPAVKLEDDSGDSFWVFERDPGVAANVDFVGVDIALENLVESPAPVFSVVPLQWRWLFWLGLLLFGGGFAAWFVESRSRGGWDGWVSAESSSKESSWDLAMWAPVGLAVGGLVISMWLGSSSTLVVALAGLIPLAMLPLATRGEDEGIWSAPLSKLVAICCALVVVSALALGGSPSSAGADIRNLLWVAQLGGWLAMGVAFLGALWCAVAPRGGAQLATHLVAGVAVSAAGATIGALGYQRAGGLVDGLALPIASDGQEVQWAMEGVLAAQGLAFPLVAESELLVMAVVLIVAGGAIAAIGAWRGARLGVRAGWVAVLGGGAMSLRELLGYGELSVLAAEAYEQLARQWLRARQLPTELVDFGEFSAQEYWAVDATQLTVELGLAA